MFFGNKQFFLVGSFQFAVPSLKFKVYSFGFSKAASAIFRLSTNKLKTANEQMQELPTGGLETANYFPYFHPNFGLWNQGPG